MASDIDICNMALVLLGAETISNISPPDDNDRARACAAFYASSRDAVLRAHDWNFAISRQTLNADTENPPISGYTYAFVLPTDPYCLRVISANEEPEADWVIEGRRLLSDDSSMVIKYLGQVTTPGTFDSLFVETLAARMAENLALPITKSSEKMKLMHDLYVLKLAEARGVNDHERGKVPEPTSPFIRVR